MQGQQFDSQSSIRLLRVSLGLSTSFSVMIDFFVLESTEHGPLAVVSAYSLVDNSSAACFSQRLAKREVNMSFDNKMNS
jgi:hypothetical protein